MALGFLLMFFLSSTAHAQDCRDECMKDVNVAGVAGVMLSTSATIASIPTSLVTSTAAVQISTNCRTTSALILEANSSRKSFYCVTNSTNTASVWSSLGAASAEVGKGTELPIQTYYSPPNVNYQDRLSCITNSGVQNILCTEFY